SGNRIRNNGWHSYKSIRRAAKCGEPHTEARLYVAVEAGAQKIVGGMGIGVAALKHKPARHLLAQTHDQCVVAAAVPGAIGVDRLVAGARFSFTGVSWHPGFKRYIGEANAQDISNGPIEIVSIRCEILG